jgi:Helitron helicase-like domain at N-terminus
MFVVLNILQRRKICLGAKLITSQATLPHVARLLKDLDYAAVHEKLAREIRSGAGRQLFSDPVLRQLMEATSIANGMVRGNQEYIRARRHEIRALFSKYGGPKFFITINPNDTTHPLVLELKEADHTVPYFKTTITDSFTWYHRMRCKIVAANPVLQAQFFDIIFRAIIDYLFGFGRQSKIGNARLWNRIGSCIQEPININSSKLVGAHATHGRKQKQQSLQYASSNILRTVRCEI